MVVPSLPPGPPRRRTVRTSIRQGRAAPRRDRCAQGVRAHAQRRRARDPRAALAERLTRCVRRSHRWSAAIRRSAARSARCWRWRKRARSARSSPSPPSPPRQAVPLPRRRPRTAGGPFGILQPKLTRPAGRARPHPGAADRRRRRGTRLGRGKGHYDRVLAPLRNGRAADRRRLAAPAARRGNPRRPWDVPLDGFASPDVSPSRTTKASRGKIRRVAGKAVIAARSASVSGQRLSHLRIRGARMSGSSKWRSQGGKWRPKRAS
jgi:hypothetical protein